MSKKKIIIFSIIAIVVTALTVIAVMYINNFDSRSSAGAGAVYYLATNGSDSNPGTSSQPIKTFAKARTLLTPGSTLYINGGTYKETLLISNSGTATERITIKNTPNQQVIIDGSGSNKPIEISGKFITISGIKSLNGKWAGIVLNGSDIIAENIEVVGSQSHGIFTQGSRITVKNSVVHDSVLEGVARNSWGSAVKAEKGSDGITFENVTAFHNHGEGFGITMSKNVMITNSLSYDNLSVNFYIDNSPNVTLQNSYAYCTNNPTYFRSGSRASGISIGEEQYTGWGAQLDNLIIRNNIIDSCTYGIMYYGSDVPNGGLSSVKIQNNSFLRSLQSPLYFAQETYKTKNSFVQNNIFDNSTTKAEPWNENSTGITFSNNLWTKKLPATGGKVAGANDIVGMVVFAQTNSVGNSSSYKFASTNPGVNKGVAISGLTNDYYGGSRPNGGSYDIGHHEYGSTSTTPTPTPTPTGNQTTKVDITQDAYVHKTNATSNFGASTNLVADNAPVMLTYLKLDLTAFASKTVSSANLKLYVKDPANALTHYIYSTNNASWNESTITYNSRPSMVSKFKTFTGKTTGSLVTIDLTSYVVSNKGKTVTIVIKSPNTDAIWFASSENSTNKPYLTVNYTN